MSDFTILARDIAGDAATSATDKLADAAQKVRPTEEELGQIDEPAPENDWRDAPDSGKFDKYRGAFNKDGDEAAKYKQQALDAKDQRVGQVKNYLGDKVPKERREQIIMRLKKLVVEIQGHQDFQNAVDSLLDLLETHKSKAKDSFGSSAGDAKKFAENDHLQIAQNKLRTLIERFANDSSLGDLFAVVDDLYRSAQHDNNLRAWFSEVDSYIRRVLKEKGYILEERSNEEFNNLYDRGQEIFSKQYKGYGDRFSKEANYLFEQFRVDPLNQRFGKNMDTLFKDLGTDEDGSVKFKPHLLKDITGVIIPELFEQVRYVPLPRIEYSDKAIDAVVENLIIESNNLFPNLVEVHNQSVLKWGRSVYSDASMKHGSFTISCTGIQCDLRDVSYYIKKKTGFPTLRDTGLADFYLGRDGLSFTISLSTATAKSPNSYFQVDNVKVNIQDLDVRLRKSRHKILFAIFRPLLLMIAKPAIKAVLQQQIKKSFNDLDQMAYDVRLEKKRIAHDVKVNPDSAKKPSIFQMYSDAVKNEMFKSREKKAEANKGKPDREAKTNIAMTQHDSMFKNIILPKGISSNKATKYKEMALSGERWTSPIFSIGSASVTDSIGGSEKISRRDEKLGAAGAGAGAGVGSGTGYNTSRGGNTGSGGYSEKPLATAGAAGAGIGTGTTARGSNYNQERRYEGVGVGERTAAYDPGNTAQPAIPVAKSQPGLYEKGVSHEQTVTQEPVQYTGSGANYQTVDVGRSNYTIGSGGTAGADSHPRSAGLSVPGQYEDSNFPTMRSKQTPSGVQPMRVAEKVEQRIHQEVKTGQFN